MWKYLAVGAMMFLIGTGTVAATPTVKKFVIASNDGERTADVSPQSRLLVDSIGQVSITENVNIGNLPAVQDVSVRNFPAVQAISGEVTVDNGQPQLITLLHSVSVLGGEIRDSSYVDVERFSQFKGFVRWEGPAGPGAMSTTFIESMDGVTDTSFFFAAERHVGTQNIAPADYVVDFSDSPYTPPPYKYLKVRVSHTNIAAQKVSVFLYAVP